MPCLIICWAANWVPKNALFKLTIEHHIVLGLGRIEDRGARFDAGVVHHDIHVAERLDGLIDQVLQL